MSRGRQRRIRRGERGLTLIELLVTISLMGVGFLSLLAGFSTIELAVGATSDDAQLTSLARQVSDVIESESFAYVQCTGPLGQAPSGAISPPSYQTAIRSAVTTTYTISILAVAQAQGSGSSHTVSGVSSPLLPINGCSAGPAAGPDYGVQQIKFQVASAHHSLTRIVYKRWN
jgi:prepilin-type N-terminal cleavage/methylation domain-containing protein